jgi:hypothetical protein
LLIHIAAGLTAVISGCGAASSSMARVAIVTRCDLPGRVGRGVRLGFGHGGAALGGGRYHYVMRCSFSRKSTMLQRAGSSRTSSASAEVVRRMNGAVAQATSASRNRRAAAWRPNAARGPAPGARAGGVAVGSSRGRAHLRWTVLLLPCTRLRCGSSVTRRTGARI